jgi:NADPH-dependent 2,4-dienoyl-CoA reductase/sulfur reductase-like enzyme
MAVIGGGPAGLSAAIEAAKNGVKVTLIDENCKAGGQLFKQIHRFFGSEEHLAGTRGFEIGNMLLQDASHYGVEVLLNNVVWGLFPDLRLGIADQDRVDIVEPEKVVVATGGCENALSFPGWTLPNIMGAGAAQTLINVNRVLPGKRAVMIGSGNVGLIVAYQLMQAGAEVAAVVEALPDIGGYKVHASKIARMGIPILTSHTITGAYGKNFVEKVEIAELDKNFKIIEESKRELEVDLVCIAVGLRPLAELCWIAGMKFDYISELGGFVPLHDENMQSTVPGIYVSGDVTGIEEASTAIEEGRIAGIALSMEMGRLAKKPGIKMLARAKERLRNLRLGPFGEYRNAAKKSIQKRYYQ